MTNKIKVSIVQSSPVFFDKEKTLNKLQGFVQKATQQESADLVLFPETFIGGYPKGEDFAVKLGFRLPEGREIYKKYYDSAIDTSENSEDIKFLSNVASENEVYLVVGSLEKDGGTLYCSVVFFDSKGNYLGKHRKLMPTAMERVVWGQGDSSTMSVFKTEIGNIGAAICWENYMPLLRTHMYQEGVQIYCAPTVDDRDNWISTIRHIALEGRCFVLSACQFMTKRDYPKGIALNEDPDVLIRGGSCIMSPLGEFLAEPVYNKECIISAELNLEDITKAKFDLDVVGHYARPDVFQLVVK